MSLGLKGLKLKCTHLVLRTDFWVDVSRGSGLKNKKIKTQHNRKLFACAERLIHTCSSPRVWFVQNTSEIAKVP